MVSLQTHCNWSNIRRSHCSIQASLIQQQPRAQAAEPRWLHPLAGAPLGILAAAVLLASPPAACAYNVRVEDVDSASLQAGELNVVSS